MSKPLTYTFNGFEHTMSAEEVEAIERLGPLAKLERQDDIPLKQKIAAMIARPGVRWEDKPEVIKPLIFHVDGNCLWDDGIRISTLKFICQYKIHPSVCCKRCARRLNRAGKMSMQSTKDRLRFLKLRRENEKRAEARA